MYDVDTRAKLRKQVYKKKLHYKFSSDILKSFSWQFLRKDLFLPEVSVACKWFEYRDIWRWTLVIYIHSMNR